MKLCHHFWFGKSSRKIFLTSMHDYSTGYETRRFPCMLIYLHEATFFILFFYFLIYACSVLLRRECTTFSNGEYVKAGLSKLYHWCYKETEEYVGSAWDELKHIRQAVGFLVIHQKPKKTLDEISHVMCPILNRQQLYRISTRYSDDKYVTHSLSPDVIQNMRMLMDSDNSESSSFLLDDDSSIPFSVDDLSKSMDEMNIEDVEPPPLISDNSGFSFLKGRHES
uniref:Dilute domain-containing protein n=1 Tax=Lactuca sativa TaxID=4236 RepID=A0A9R1UNU2_LACSA|nr:hypothetical protein LSAT_V11C800425920 [Lactuca sativa]